MSFKKFPASATLSLVSEGTHVTFATKATEGAALILATGSASHVEQLEALAAGQGYRLDAAGLWSGGKRVAGADETSVYEAIGT